MSGCPKKVKAKGLCAAHYETKRRGKLSAESTKKRTPVYSHRLSEIDKSSLTATCAACGVTEVYYRTDKRVYACKSAKRASQADYMLRRTYGIGLEDKKKLLEGQNGLCAVCLRHIDLFSSHLDHIHGTKVIRGVLCGPCNQALGLMQESPTVVSSALEYLRKHS